MVILWRTMSLRVVSVPLPPHTQQQPVTQDLGQRQPSPPPLEMTSILGDGGPIDRTQWDFAKAIRDYPIVFPELPPMPPTLAAADASLCDGSAGATLRIAVFVLAWRRVNSLRRALASLQMAEYCGGRLSLTVLFDAQPSEAAVAVARGVVWTHGPYRVVVARTSHGVRGMWVHALSRELEREPSATHVLPLEDDNEVSPLFYYWLTRVEKAYGPFDTSAGARRFGSLVGVSLYSPRHDEIAYPMRTWRPRWRSAAGLNHAAYLFQLPCSWGALFFRDAWRRFVQVCDCF